MNGNILSDRYQLEEKIGVGGMAEVYRGVDKTLGRSVAVKILHPQYAVEKNFVARFKREAQSAANLNQPNIVNVYDWAAESGTYYLVMEYLVGKDLKQVIKEHGKLPVKRAIDIASQVATALQFAHKNEIVHRDIKPQNIIITDEGEVKVTDFGIARSISSNVTQTSAILGTAHYLSPEQAKSEEVGAVGDIYSLGVVIYEMLTGEVPFTGESPVAVALKHIQDQPKAPRELNPDIPVDLEAVVQKAMAKNPANRYASATELKEDLARCAEGLPVTAPLSAAENDLTMEMPRPVYEEHDRPVRRGPVKIIGLVAFFVLLFAGSALATNYILKGMARIEAPDLSGKTVEGAERFLKTKQLALGRTNKAYNTKVKSGKIISQNPKPGTKLRTGASISIVVSRGEKLINIPDFTNKILSQATVSLVQLGLNVGNIRRDYNATISEDYVIMQDPPKDARVTENTYVNLVVSKGPRPQKTPNLVNKMAAEAGSIVSAEGLIMSKQEAYHEEVEAGRVIDQSPAVGVPIERGETVTVTISKGPKLISVPSVKGLDEDAAKTQLESAGFLAQIKEGVADSDMLGKVITQSPQPKTEVRKGSTITIWVGREPSGDMD